MAHINLSSGLTRISRSSKELRNCYPDQPWRWKPEWDRREIRCNSMSKMIWLWVFTLIWNGFSFPITFLLVNQEVVKGDNPVALLVLFFPLVGLGFIVASVRATIRWNKYGSSTLALANECGVIGGELVGTVRFSKQFRLLAPATVKLSCQRQRTTGSGKNRSTHTTTVWEQSQSVDWRHFDARSGFPIKFKIPFQCESTSEEDRNYKILWSVVVSAPVKGVDFSSTFDVPVFKTAASDPKISSASVAIEELATTETPPSVGDLVGIKFRNIDGGSEFTFGIERSGGSVIGSVIFLLIWLAGTVACALYAPWPVTIFPVLIAIVFLIAAIVLMGGETKIFASNQVLRSNSSIFGFSLKSTSFARSEIREVIAKSGGEQGNATQYKLFVALDDGTLPEIASGFSSLQSAQALAIRIRQALGPKPERIDGYDDENEFGDEEDL